MLLAMPRSTTSISVKGKDVVLTNRETSLRFPAIDAARMVAEMLDPRAIGCEFHSRRRP